MRRRVPARQQSDADSLPVRPRPCCRQPSDRPSASSGGRCRSSASAPPWCAQIRAHPRASTVPACVRSSSRPRKVLAYTNGAGTKTRDFSYRVVMRREHQHRTPNGIAGKGGAVVKGTRKGALAGRRTTPDLPPMQSAPAHGAAGLSLYTTEQDFAVCKVNRPLIIRTKAFFEQIGRGGIAGEG